MIVMNTLFTAFFISNHKGNQIMCLNNYSMLKFVRWGWFNNLLSPLEYKAVLINFPFLNILQKCVNINKFSEEIIGLRILDCM